MLSFGLQKHQRHLFSTFQSFKYVKRTLIQAFVNLKRSCVHGFFQLRLEKHHFYHSFSFLTTGDFICYLFQGFSKLITYTAPCLFIYSVQKRHCYVSTSNLASKSIIGTLFVVCLSLNTFFLLFSGILACKYIKHSYAVAVYTVNTRSTSYCVFLPAENVPLTFHPVVWPSKHEPYLCFNFQTSQFVIFLLLSSLFLPFRGILTCNCINRTYPIVVSLGKT